MCQTKKNRRGFSLIELMIVIAIIGILAAVAVPSYQTYIKKAEISKAFPFAVELKNALIEKYYETGSFPDSFVTPTFGTLEIEQKPVSMGHINMIEYWRTPDYMVVFVYFDLSVLNPTDGIYFAMTNNGVPGGPLQVTCGLNRYFYPNEPSSKYMSPPCNVDYSTYADSF